MCVCVPYDVALTVLIDRCVMCGIRSKCTTSREDTERVCLCTCVNVGAPACARVYVPRTRTSLSQTTYQCLVPCVGMYVRLMSVKDAH